MITMRLRKECSISSYCRDKYKLAGMWMWRYSCWYWLDRRRWEVSIMFTMNTMPLYMLPWDPWHGVDWPDGLFSHRIWVTIVSCIKGVYGWNFVLNGNFITIVGLLSRMFSWRGFLVTTRLSYAIYLTQFPVFFFNVGRNRHAGYFSFLSNVVSTIAHWFLTKRNRDFWIHSNFFLSFQLNLNENIAIAVASIALTIFFDTPFQNIKKIVFNQSNKSSSRISSNQLEKPEQSSHAKELKLEWFFVTFHIPKFQFQIRKKSSEKLCEIFRIAFYTEENLSFRNVSLWLEKRSAPFRSH